MGSNIYQELENKIARRFTPAELVEFLGISIETLMDRLEIEIDLNIDELMDELN